MNFVLQLQVFKLYINAYIFVTLSKPRRIYSDNLGVEQGFYFIPCYKCEKIIDEVFGGGEEEKVLTLIRARLPVAVRFTAIVFNPDNPC